MKTMLKNLSDKKATDPDVQGLAASVRAAAMLPVDTLDNYTREDHVDAPSLFRISVPASKVEATLNALSMLGAHVRLVRSEWHCQNRCMGTRLRTG